MWFSLLPQSGALKHSDGRLRDPEKRPPDVCLQQKRNHLAERRATLYIPLSMRQEVSVNVLLHFLTRGGLVGLSFLVSVGTLTVSPNISIFSTSQAMVSRFSEDRFMGREAASVTVIDYSSLTCPHCADFHTQILPRFKEHYIDTGKVKFIYRDFSVDPVATAAAMLARCVPHDPQDRYFRFIDVLFSHQKTWSRASKPRQELVNLARLGGLSETEVNQCLSDATLLADLNAMKNEAISMYGIKATPSFVIGGRTYVGVTSYDALASLVEKALQRRENENSDQSDPATRDRPSDILPDPDSGVH